MTLILKTTASEIYKITSSISTVKLYDEIKFNYFKIRTLRFKTVSPNNTMNIYINGMNINKFYGNNFEKVFKTIFLPDTPQLFIYENNIFNEFDFYSEKQQFLKTLEIQIMIDESMTNDISTSNPLYIEIFYM